MNATVKGSDMVKEGMPRGSFGKDSGAPLPLPASAPVPIPDTRKNTAWREARQTREYEFVWPENDVAGVQPRTLNHLRFRARDELDNFRYPLERSVECRRKPILESGTTQVKVGAMVRPGGQAADAEGGIPYPTQAYTLGSVSIDRA